jgi:hypothetical protein
MKDDDVRLVDVVRSIATLSTSAHRNAVQAAVQTVISEMSRADQLLLSQQLHIGWNTSTKELRAYARACAMVELTLTSMMFQTGRQLIANYLTNVFTGADSAMKVTAATTKLNTLCNTLDPSFLATGRYDYNRPVRPGTSISAANHQGPGTLGCFVRDRTTGRIMLLSNMHVLEKWNNVSTRLVLQPARFNGGCSALSIGEFANGTLDHRMDAAVASLKPGIAYLNTFPNGTVIAGTNNVVAVGEVVWKYGCMSGRTQGKIASVNYATGVPHQGHGTVNFVNQYNITSASAFQIPGDSGSVLMNGQNQVIGLLHGGRADGGALATPIDDVLNHLHIDVV